MSWVEARNRIVVPGADGGPLGLPPGREAPTAVELGVISPTSRYALGSRIIGDLSPATGAYPSANRAILYPFVLPGPAIVRQLGWWNGTSVSGNADVGIYDRDGRRLVSTGSTAKSGATARQLVDVADTPIPGLALLFVAFASDDGASIFRVTFGGNAGNTTSTGIRMKDASFPLPASLTGTSTPTGYLPFAFARLVAL